MHSFTLQPLSVMSDGGSREGRLVLADGILVAVFTRVSDSEAAGSGVEGRGWFLEAGFGPCGVLMTAVPPVFATLEEAVDWVGETLDQGLPTA